jgi:hypothetical protein
MFVTFKSVIVTPLYRFRHDMSRFAQDFDDLERLIDGNAAKDEIRSQLRFIAREVAALEAEYARAIENQIQSPLEHRRSVYYASGDPVPFCPHCYEASAGKRIHLSGPMPLHASKAERWDCYACNTYYVAEPGENFLPHRKTTGRFS